MTDYSTLLTIEQFSALTNTPARTIRHRLKVRGTFGAVRIGRRWYFPEATLESPLALAG